jgi:hypothetical protein
MLFFTIDRARIKFVIVMRLARTGFLLKIVVWYSANSSSRASFLFFGFFNKDPIFLPRSAIPATAPPMIPFTFDNSLVVS